MDFKARARAVYERGRERTTPLRLAIASYVRLPWRLFRSFCFALGFVVIIVVIGLASSVGGFVRSLPPVQRMSFEELKAAAMERIQSRATNPKYKHRWVSLKEVHRAYLYSVVFSEDATFFEHDGFNLDAIVDSIAENLRERKAAFGGSTISQQVIKNLFLTNEKTLTRKLKELLLTRGLESHFSKNEILEVYFNVAEFGPDIFGVGVAAWHFFHKVPATINAAEGCFIALMLPSPKRYYYSIYENRNLSRQKRRRIERVLRAMLYEELITDVDYVRFVKFNYFNGKSATGRLPARAR